MKLGLEGHTAVIVGGARGIGRAIAEAFAAEGANLAILDVDASVHTTATELNAIGQAVDVTDYQAVQQTIPAIQSKWGRIDHIVFAVAIGSGKFGFPFWNLQPSDWGRVMNVNVMGAVNVAHSFAPELVKAKSGTMLFLASVAGQIGSQTDPPYSASKAALINFAQCAAKDLAPFGVRVNSLNPGMVKTTLNRSVWESWANQQPEGSRKTYDEWAGEKVKTIVPLGRWQEPEDIASMAVFLASSRAANVTGQSINVDGGYVMHW